MSGLMSSAGRSRLRGEMRIMKILALDLGGTAVKARIYSSGLVEKESSWSHDYRDCSLDQGKEDLLSKIKDFLPGKIEAVGLGVAGLIATDNSLYRSTVLSSFEKFNLPDFLREELKVKAVTIDNDADCGAFSEKYFCQPGENGFLYAVVGSGIGSAYVDCRGELPYLTRFDPNHRFFEQDNPLANDLGQRVVLPREEICRKLRDYEIRPEGLEKVVGKVKEIKVGKLGSAAGMKTILEMLFSGRNGLLEGWHEYRVSQFLKEHPEKKEELDLIVREKTLAKNLAYFAESGDYYATAAFELMGYFLGRGIAEALMVIKEEHHLEGFPEICLSGPVMNSFSHLKKELQKSLLERKVACPVRLSLDLSGSNLHGAYLRAKEALEQR